VRDPRLGSRVGLQAICDAVAVGTCPVELVRLITDNPSAQAIARHRERGLPITVVDWTSYPDRAAYETALREAMANSGAELFVLAGYMRLLSPRPSGHFRTG